MPTASPIFSIAAALPGSCACSTSKTLGFADFSGNRQYISTGNLADNAKATLFLMDYANRMRVKIWGTARAVENDPALTATLFPDGYKARAEQAIVFTVEAWDLNCPQHIPQMFFAEDVAAIGRALRTAHRRARSRECAAACGPVRAAGYFAVLTGKGAANSQPNTTAPANAPSSSATMKPGASAGAMPANVLLRLRAMVTAGLANEVEAVNQ